MTACRRRHRMPHCRRHRRDNNRASTTPPKPVRLILSTLAVLSAQRALYYCCPLLAEAFALFKNYIDLSSDSLLCGALPVSVKVYYGSDRSSSALEIRRFMFKPTPRANDSYDNITQAAHVHLCHHLFTCIQLTLQHYGAPSSSHEQYVYQPTAYSAIGVSARNSVYSALLDRIGALYGAALDVRFVHLCWKDDDGDYVVFSSDDELKVNLDE